MEELKENTVQQTLCMPLWGRAIAAEKYPSLFPDHDARSEEHTSELQSQR